MLGDKIRIEHGMPMRRIFLKSKVKTNVFRLNFTNTSRVTVYILLLVQNIYYSSCFEALIITNLY